MHKITLEKVFPFNKEQFLPFYVKGKRGCLPEDVGGAWGYNDFLEKWNNENHPEYEELREWAGDYFDPETFNQSYVNEVIHGEFNRV